jgi:hypothetical protein
MDRANEKGLQNLWKPLEAFGCGGVQQALLAAVEECGALSTDQARTFQGLKALSSSIPFIANATDGKCREITDFIEFSSTHSIPCFE